MAANVTEERRGERGRDKAHGYGKNTPGEERVKERWGREVKR